MYPNFLPIIQVAMNPTVIFLSKALFVVSLLCLIIQVRKK